MTALPDLPADRSQGADPAAVASLPYRTGGCPDLRSTLPTHGSVVADAECP
jgi:hypothetical protein